MRTVLLPIHISAGLTAIITGFMALYAAKGAKLHRKLGMIFVYSMVILGLTGAVIALLKLDVGTAMGGVLAFYLVITGLVTFRRPRRLARHLWRMCFAMFIATGSFFLGQAKVFPKPIRIMPLLSLPVLIVIVAMLYWLWRVRIRRNVSGMVGYSNPAGSVHPNVRPRGVRPLQASQMSSNSMTSIIRSITLLFLTAITLASTAAAQWPTIATPQRRTTSAASQRSTTTMTAREQYPDGAQDQPEGGAAAVGVGRDEVG